MSTCHFCGPTDEELRPYGPGGSTICFSCMKASPEREMSAKGALGALMDANSVFGPIVIGEEDGPRPFDPDTG